MVSWLMFSVNVIIKNMKPKAQDDIEHVSLGDAVIVAEIQQKLQKMVKEFIF